MKNKNGKKKSSNMPLMIAAAVILCAAVIVFFVTKEGKQKEAAAEADVLQSEQTDALQSDQAEEREEADGKAAQETEQSEQPARETTVVEAGGSLVIPEDEVTTTVQFYPVEVDGVQMEVIAVKDSEGNIRTAFNTCQVCYNSGRGYYKQEGNTLVCQNCGNRFTVDQVEIESGGCNPWPIFAENKTVTEDSVAISYDFLHEATQVFENWKTRQY